MDLHVREMQPDEIPLRIDYFHGASDEALKTMGVERDLLPSPEQWRASSAADLRRPYAQRETMLLVWLCDDRPIGFSSADRIHFGDHARMHLHVLRTQDRRRGIGAECVRKSADLYFKLLKIERLYCEPNAYNIAPNRTLQRVGFKFLKTYETVPGPINFHQPVTQWVLEKSPQ